MGDERLIQRQQAASAQLQEALSQQRAFQTERADRDTGGIGITGGVSPISLGAGARIGVAVGTGGPIGAALSFAAGKFISELDKAGAASTAAELQTAVISARIAYARTQSPYYDPETDTIVPGLSSSSQQTTKVAEQAAAASEPGDTGASLSMPPMWARDP